MWGWGLGLAGAQVLLPALGGGSDDCSALSELVQAPGTVLGSQGVLHK